MKDPTPRVPIEDASTLATPAGAPLPRHIGQYKIVRKIGEGGMGIVYEAAQAEPRRAVALKVIRGGRFVDENTIKMFRREAQTLARLKHPGIAAIYESGHTDDGQHFFAMEMVRGETLGAWLKKRVDVPLTTTEVRLRLALFRKICEAVAYAHQRGVIHRDLKPGNILVSQDHAGVTDTSWPDLPAIKILDFGLARITDGDVAVTTVITEIGKLQGTLAYMSPEQLRGNSDEIDLRSDLYSLGVILHQILTGKLPYLILQVPVTEAARIISQQAPTAPSKVWPGPKRPDRDIDTIVLKALEKEPQRRYQSVTSLATDIDRYLTNQPILARPPSTLYQVRKMAARNKAAFTLAAAVLVMLAGFAVTMAVQAKRIASERDRANQEAETAKQVSEFLVGLFEVSDPSESRGNTITAREILDRGAGKIERELKEQPLVQASMMDTMGRVYGHLGLAARAEPLLAEALTLRRKELGEDHPDVARSLNELGWLYLLYQGRGAEARGLHERALDILEKTYGLEHPDVAWSCYFLGHVTGDASENRRLLKRALEIFKKNPASNYKGLSWCLNDLGLEREGAGDLEGARNYYEQSLRIKEQRLGPDDPDVAITLRNLASVFTRMERYAEARPALERALAITEKTLSPDHSLLPEALNQLAWNLGQAGRLEEALSLAERAVGLFEKSLGPDHSKLADALHTQGELLRMSGDLARARPLLERAIAIDEKTLEPEHPQLAEPLHTLGMVLAAQGERGEAEKLLRRALAIREKRLSPNHLQIAESLEGLASLLRKAGHDVEAEPLEARAREIRQRLGKPQ